MFGEFVDYSNVKYSLTTIPDMDLVKVHVVKVHVMKQLKQSKKHYKIDLMCKMISWCCGGSALELR